MALVAVKNASAVGLDSQPMKYLLTSTKKLSRTYSLYLSSTNFLVVNHLRQSNRNLNVLIVCTTLKVNVVPLIYLSMAPTNHLIATTTPSNHVNQETI